MTSHHIVALVAKQGASAADVVIACAAVTHTHFIADDIVAVTAVDFAGAEDGVVPVAAIECVVAVVVGNVFGTRPAGDEIVALAAHHAHIAIAASNRVIAKSTEDHVGVAVGVGGGAGVNLIVAVSAIDGVIVRATAD